MIVRLVELLDAKFKEEVNQITRYENLPELQARIGSLNSTKAILDLLSPWSNRQR